jgi:hypothetical protein
MGLRQNHKNVNETCIYRKGSSMELRQILSWKKKQKQRVAMVSVDAQSSRLLLGKVVAR